MHLLDQFEESALHNVNTTFYIL